MGGSMEFKAQPIFVFVVVLLFFCPPKTKIVPVCPWCYILVLCIYFFWFSFGNDFTPFLHFCCQYASWALIVHQYSACTFALYHHWVYIFRVLTFHVFLCQASRDRRDDLPLQWHCSHRCPFIWPFVCPSECPHHWITAWVICYCSVCRVKPRGVTAHLDRAQIKEPITQQTDVVLCPPTSFLCWCRQIFDSIHTFSPWRREIMFQDKVTNYNVSVTFHKVHSENKCWFLYFAPRIQVSN